MEILRLYENTFQRFDKYIFEKDKLESYWLLI